MKKKYKSLFKVIPVILWPLVLFGFGFYLCCHPKGFCFEKIRSNFIFNQNLTTAALSNEEFEKIRPILNQNFTYLASGAYFYSFVSEDQKYVIKFLKMKRLTPKRWLNYIPLPFMEKYRFEKIEKRNRFREELFENFQNAFDEFRIHTGLVFLHFHKTFYSKDEVIITDEKGRKHRIPLNTVPFIVQKKATHVYPYVASLIENGEKDRALDALISVLYLIKKRSLKGYVDKDGDISSNYGFIDHRPVEIDIRHVVKDETVKDPVNYLREVLKISQKMDLWLKATYPELSPLFLQRAQHHFYD